jgi:hypothetical protein
MSTVERENQMRPSPYPDGHWHGPMYPYRERPRNLAADLVVIGMVGAGLGLLAWHYLGPDIRRYLKIRDM